MGRGTKGLDGLVQDLYGEINEQKKALEKKDQVIEDKDAQLKKANEVIQNITLTKSSSRRHTEATIEKVDKGKRKRPTDDSSEV